MPTRAYWHSRIPSIKSLITGLTIYVKTGAVMRRSFFAKTGNSSVPFGCGQIKNKFNSAVPPAVIPADNVYTVTAEGGSVIIIRRRIAMGKRPGDRLEGYCLLNKPYVITETRPNEKSKPYKNEDYPYE